jgi:hypothetical protein
MTEAEYVNATNLKTVRILRRLLQEILPTGGLVTEEELDRVTAQLLEWESRLEKAVVTEGPKRPVE